MLGPLFKTKNMLSHVQSRFGCDVMFITRSCKHAIYYTFMPDYCLLTILVVGI